jgi:radical SAM protein with 4Fe4S-binding SPASM domain
MQNASPNTLRLLFWESTSRCNLACIHCRRQDVAEAAAADDLRTEQVERLIASVATLGKPIFVFSGGEPLMRDDWPRLAAAARLAGLPTALATNATLIDAALAGRVAEAGFHRVSVSLDGADAVTHDAFRGVAGAFDRARAGATFLRRAGVSIQVNATIAAHNAHQLQGLLDLARDLDAVALHLFLLVPVGCGLAIDRSHQLPPARYEQVLEWICDRQAEGGLEIKATCAPHYQRLAARRGLLKRPTRGCLCGLSVAFVSHKGEVFPCGYLPVNCGSVRDREFADIWRDSEVFAKLRNFDLLSGKCGRCEYKGLCGGCRARAFAATGDYLAAEPSCTHQPNKA